MNKLLAAIVALESEARDAKLNVQVRVSMACETPTGGTYLSVQSLGGPAYSGTGTTAHEAAGNLLASAGVAKNDANNVIVSFGPAPVS